jgi:gas vesicle protein
MARITDTEERFTTELKLMADGLNLRISDAVDELQTKITVTAEGLQTEVTDAVRDLRSEITQTAEGLHTEVTDAVKGLQSEITQTAQGIQAQITTLDGRVSTVTQTAEGLQTKVSDQGGQISTLTQTAQGLSSRVATAEGNISSVTQTAQGLSSRVSNAEGAVSAVTQKVNGLTLSVSNSGSSSTIRLMSNGVYIGSSGTVSFTGYVTFSDLSGSGGSTIINGAKIMTGTLAVSQIDGLNGKYISRITLNAATIDMTGSDNVMVHNFGSGSSINLCRHKHALYKGGSGPYSSIYLDSDGKQTSVEMKDVIWSS